jgi:hypothetical protein
MLMMGLFVSESIVSPATVVIFFVLYITTVLVGHAASAAVTHTVAVRAGGGNANLGQSLSAVVTRVWPLLVWLLISGTIGMGLRFLSERSVLLGKLLANVLGAAWNTLTIFVLPAIMLEKQATLPALKHSAAVFTKHWGETVITNISIKITFLLLHLVALALFLGSVYISTATNQIVIFAVGAGLWLFWILIALLLERVLTTIVTTLLYIYATAPVPPANFNHELIDQILQRSRMTPVVLPESN